MVWLASQQQGARGLLSGLKPAATAQVLKLAVHGWVEGPIIPKSSEKSRNHSFIP
jgi:hypothetical protein